jgi:hypothetical protein
MRRARWLQQEQHDPSGEELLERLGLSPLDRRDEVGQRHDVEAAGKRGAGEGDQDLPVSIDAHPGRIALRERGGQREAEGRYAPLTQADQQRHAPDEAVGVGGRERVSDVLRRLHERRKRCRTGAGVEQLGRLREHGPGAVARRQLGVHVARSPGRRVERDREHNVAGQENRLAQHRVARRAAPIREARLSERHVDPDDRRARSRQVRDEAGNERAVPCALAGAPLARRITNDDDQIGAHRERGPPAKPRVVERPLERGEPGATQDQDAAGHEGGGGAHQRCQRCALHRRRAA